jgi:hypothetical protein
LAEVFTVAGTLDFKAIKGKKNAQNSKCDRFSLPSLYLHKIISDIAFQIEIIGP